MTSRLVEQLGVDSVAGATAATLAERIRALVLDGRLTVGERLPSERSLALELRRSRSTMTRAYDILESGGYVNRVHGGGTRVALPHSATAAPTDADESSIDLSIASMDSTPGLYDATVRSLPRLPRCAARADTRCAACPSCVRPWRTASPSAASTPTPTRS